MNPSSDAGIADSMTDLAEPDIAPLEDTAEPDPEEVTAPNAPKERDALGVITGADDCLSGICTMHLGNGSAPRPATPHAPKVGPARLSGREGTDSTYVSPTSPIFVSVSHPSPARVTLPMCA